MSDSTWYSRDSEAESLATQLRTQRLTLLYGAPRSGKTTLLTTGVLPLLQRRVSDELTGQPPAAGGVVLPFPDRRTMPDDGQDAQARMPAGRHFEPDAEAVVFFDAWDDAPLDGLIQRMREALNLPNFDAARRRRSLASTLGSFHRQRGGKSLIVLDRFEEFLIKPEYAPGVRQFSDAFIDAMNRPGLPVHFLVSLNEDAAPLIERFRGRIAGLDDHCMRLPPLQQPQEGPPPIPVLRQVPDGYRPPIDLELPQGSRLPSIPPARSEAPEAPSQAAPAAEAPSPAHAASRQPDWVDSAFAAPASGHMKTQDVYASMEALLGKIAQSGREKEEEGSAALPEGEGAPVQPSPGAAQAGPAPAAAAPAKPVATPEAPAASTGTPATQAASAAPAARVPSKPVAPMKAKPAAPAAAKRGASPTPAKPAVVPSAPAAAGEAAARTPVVGRLPEAGRGAAASVEHWSSSTMRGQPDAAPEFAPIFTFEGDSQPAPASGEGGVMMHAAGAMHPAASADDGVPANSDWLSEVHASLTKLSSRGDPDMADDGQGPMLVDPYPVTPLEVRRGNSARHVAIAVLAVFAIVLVLIGLTFLPEAYRPFDMPESIGKLLSIFNSPLSPSNYGQ